jgi:hypothetical protein
MWRSRTSSSEGNPNSGAHENLTWVSFVLLGSNNAEWASVVRIDGCIVQKTHLKPKRKKKKLSFATVGQMPRPGARWTGLLPNFRGSLKVNIFRGPKGLVAA